MKNNLKIFKNGYTLYSDKLNGMYILKLRDNPGNLVDSIRCDDYKMFLDYKKAFSAIGRNAK